MTTAHGKPKVGQGLFGCKDRECSDIIHLQKKLLSNLERDLAKLDNYGMTKTEGFMDLLSQMVNLDPKKRISPQDILKHPFCQE